MSARDVIAEAHKLLVWAADSFAAHAKTADHPEEQCAYLDSEKMYRKVADDISVLTSAGYTIVRKEERDAMHRRAQIAEGLFASVTQDIDMWTHALADHPKWIDTWLFRNALGRFRRHKARAEAKLQSIPSIRSLKGEKG